MLPIEDSLDVTRIEALIDGLRMYSSMDIGNVQHSATTTLPVFRVAPVTRNLGASIIVLQKHGTNWYLDFRSWWY